MSDGVADGRAAAMRYRERNPITPPAEPAKPLDAKRLAEIDAGQQILARRVLARAFDPNYDPTENGHLPSD